MSSDQPAPATDAQPAAAEQAGVGDPDIIETQLTLHFGATLAVTTSNTGWQDFIKPSASFSTKWNGVPTEDQVALATEFIQHNVLSPILGEIITLAQERLAEARRGGLR